MSTYFKNIADSVQTLSNGLKLTLNHLWEAKDLRPPVGVEDDSYFTYDTGIVTLQYPSESIPVPDNGRYRLHNEIDDCIVCDKCAKICPVNCIDIEPIKSVEEIGKTSDGTPKRLYAARFDIDMAKCCFCGLCTTVCPTECLTMTKVYDFSEFDVEDHNYAFSEMTPLEILEKKKEEQLAAEEKLKKAQSKTPDAKTPTKPAQGKPVFKPKPMKPKVSGKTGQTTDLESKDAGDVTKPKPVFKPRPMIKKKPKDDSNDS